MGIVSTILIAIALAMDVFAVSITNGLVTKKINLKNALIMAFTFAIFHAVMPLLGYFLGLSFEKYISEIDHWIAFCLLGFLGIKMIYEGFNDNKIEEKTKIQTSLLISQAFATTIDAFVVGVSFALLNSKILIPILIIGVVTFIFAIIGLYCGKYFGNKLGKSAEIVGGFFLFGLGLKILIEHLYY